MTSPRDVDRRLDALLRRVDPEEFSVQIGGDPDSEDYDPDLVIPIRWSKDDADPPRDE